jgi:ubiquinone/menaquinone biosynthesis C-methylase UbiE
MSDHHVCPWWLAYTFDNPLRRLIHDPRKILSPFVKEGMTVIDIGCGMGYFTLGLADLVGDGGQVIAVDLQQQMLDIMLKRAREKGLAHRIIPHCAEPTAINVTTPVDFALAFWMIHEVPDPTLFFQEVAAILKPSAKLLYAEPAFHVPERRYNEILAVAEKTGLSIISPLSIRFSRAALLAKRS